MSQISKLKKRARSLYLKHVDQGPLPYTCGRALTNHITGTGASRDGIEELNGVLDQLAALDPATPKTRFKVDQDGRVGTI